MIVAMLLISSFVYVIITNTQSAVLRVLIFVILPLTVCNDFTKETNYKTELLNRRNKCVKKKNKKS